VTAKHNKRMYVYVAKNARILHFSWIFFV